MNQVSSRLGRLGEVIAASAKLIFGLLAWLGWALLFLIWFAVFCGLRILESSKRVVATSALVSLLCLGAVWRLGYVEGLAWPLAAMLVLAGMLVAMTDLWWIEYRQKLSFVVEAHPRNRRLFIDDDWCGLAHSGRVRRLEVLPVLVALGVAVLAIVFWRALPSTAQLGVLGAACALCGVAFGFHAVLVAGMERRHEVRFFWRGWRLADPAAVEAHWMQRSGGLLQVAERRRGLTAWLAPVTNALRGVLQPYEPCPASARSR